MTTRRTRALRRWTALGACGAALAAAPAAAQDAPPRVTMLSPSWSAAVNPTRVSIAALVRGGDAVLRLDGRVVRRVRRSCAEEVVAATVPAARLAEGVHVAVVSVAGHRAGSGFRVDRAAARPRRNRIEAAATPAHLACLSRTELRLLPGRTIDLARERVVLQRGGRVTATSARAFGLRRVGVRRYAFPRLTGPFVLRIGDDWGALDAGGRRTAAPAAAVDREHGAVAVVGPAGGTVAATDAAGVRVRLEVPPGALRAPVRIAVTPLSRPPLPGARLPMPGVELEPAGLVFARPALLVLDFSATGHDVGVADAISLATSPLTAVPLPGRADPRARTVAALLTHFSVLLPGLTDDEFSDLTAWADAALSGAGEDTFYELAQLLALAERQAVDGCQGGERCIDAAELSIRATLSVSTITADSCPGDVATPSAVAVEQWLVIGRAAEALGAAGDAARSCARDVLRAAILGASGSEGLLADDDLAQLARLGGLAAAIGDSGLAELANERELGILEERLLALRARCLSTSPTEIDVARADLLDLHVRAEGLRDTAPILGAYVDSLLGDVAGALADCHAPTAAPPAAEEPAGPAPAATPPAVSAAGCDAEIAAPTDGALNRRLLDEAAAPAGADTTAVRACIAGLFGALAAAAAAPIAPTDAQLLPLVDLAAKATQYGHPTSATAIRVVLADELRSLVSSAAALCATDATSARAELQRVLPWTAHTMTVDAALTDDVESILAGGCSPPAKSLSAALATSSYVNAQHGFSSGCASSPVHVYAGAVPSDPLPLPHAWSATMGAASASAQVVQTAADTLELRLDLSSPGGTLTTTCSNGLPSTSVATVAFRLWVVVTAEDAGSLQVAVDPAWEYPTLLATELSPGVNAGSQCSAGLTGPHVISSGAGVSELDYAIGLAAGAQHAVYVQCLLRGAIATSGTFATVRLR